MTRVLPDPAPARTRIGPSARVTASRCGGLSRERSSTARGPARVRPAAARGTRDGGSRPAPGGPHRSCYVGLGFGSFDGRVTHEARSPLGTGDTGVGNLTSRFARPPADGGLPIDVHGVVDATLATVDGGWNVTFHAAF